MSEPTPGSWMYSGGYPAFVAALNKDEPGNALKATVCDLDARVEKYQRPQDEVDANGYLIAAAPELLEAAKLALGAVSSRLDRLAYEALENAIAKAEEIKENV